MDTYLNIRGSSKGQKVRKGEVIGYCGYSGSSRPPGPAGSHLHWEMGNGWSGVISGHRDPTKKYFW